MAIAEALNLLISSPGAQLKKDLKDQGVTVSQFGRYMRKTFGEMSHYAKRDIEKAMHSIGIAMKEGLIDLEQYSDGMRTLKGAFKFVEAGGDSFNQMLKEAEQLNEKYSSSLDRMADKLAKLNALQKSGKLKPHVYQQAHDDITGTADQRNAEAEKSNRLAAEATRINAERASSFEKMATQMARVAELERHGLNAQAAAAMRDDATGRTAQRLEQQAEAERQLVAAQDERNRKIEEAIALNAKHDSAFKRRHDAMKKLRETARQPQADPAAVRKERDEIHKRFEDEIGLTAARARQQEVHNSVVADATALNAKHASAIETLKQGQLRLNAAKSTGLLTERAYRMEIKAMNAAYREQATLAGRLGFTLKGLKAATGFLNPWLMATVAAGKFVHVMAEFEKSMDRVQVMSGATRKEMEAMNTLASQLGATTVFSAKDAAEGMAVLARSGFKTQDIMASIPATMSLAAIGEMQVGEAAEVAARMMSAMHMPAEQLADAVDAIAVAATNSVNTVEQLGEAMKFAGPAAAQAGRSIDEVMVVLMALGNAGMIGELGGTAARNVFFRMANQTKKAKDELKNLGVSFHDVNGEFLSLIDIVKQFETAWEGKTGAEKLESANKIFQTRSATGFAALVGTGSEKLQQYQGLQDQRSGLADQMAEALNDNLLGDLERIGSALSKFATDADGLGAAFRLVVQAVTALVQSFQIVGNLIWLGFKPIIGGLLMLVGQAVKWATKVFSLGFAEGDTGQGISDVGKKMFLDSQEGIGTNSTWDALETNGQDLRETFSRMGQTLTGGGSTVGEIESEIAANEAKQAAIRDEAAEAALNGILDRSVALDEELEILRYGRMEAAARAALEQASSEESRQAISDQLELLAAKQKQYDYEKRIADLKQNVEDAQFKANTLGMTEGERHLYKTGLNATAEDYLYADQLDKANDLLEQRTKILEKQKAMEATLEKSAQTRLRLEQERISVENRGGAELDHWDSAMIDAQLQGADPATIQQMLQDAIAGRADEKRIQELQDGRKRRQDTFNDRFSQARDLNLQANPLEKFKQEFEELSVLLGAGLIDQNTFDTSRESLVSDTLKSAGPKNIGRAGAVEAGTAEAYSATLKQTVNPEYEELKKQTQLAQKDHVLLAKINQGVADFNAAKAEFPLPPP